MGLEKLLAGGASGKFIIIIRVCDEKRRVGCREIGSPLEFYRDFVAWD